MRSIVSYSLFLALTGMTLAACGSKEKGAGAATTPAPVKQGGKADGATGSTTGSKDGVDGSDGSDGSDSSDSNGDPVPANCSFDLNQELSWDADVKAKLEVAGTSIDLEIKGTAKAKIDGSSKDSKTTIALDLAALTINPPIAKSAVMQKVGDGKIVIQTLDEKAWTALAAGKKGGWAKAGCGMIPVKSVKLPFGDTIAFEGSDSIPPAFPNPSQPTNFSELSHNYSGSIDSNGQKFKVKGKVAVRKTGKKHDIDIGVSNEKGQPDSFIPGLTIETGDGNYTSLSLKFPIPGSAQLIDIVLK